MQERKKQHLDDLHDLIIALPEAMLMYLLLGADVEDSLRTL